MVREMRRASDIAAAAVMMATCTQCLGGISETGSEERRKQTGLIGGG